jgi:hypothetical protein
MGHHLAVLDLPALIESKRAAIRDKDALALPHIEAALRLHERQRLREKQSGQVSLARPARRGS